MAKAKYKEGHFRYDLLAHIFQALALFGLAFGYLGWSQTVEPLAPASRRLALVIGNKEYRRHEWVLANSVNDATSMANALSSMGFETKLVTDATLADLNRSVQELVDSVRPGDVVVFYYAGHGIQLSGENYLIPVDFSGGDEESGRKAAFNTDRLRETLENTSSRIRIIILDTCRNNPFRRTRSLGNSLAAMSNGEGTFIALSTGPGATSSDAGDGSNGLFTGFLLDSLKLQGLELNEVFSQVRAKVKERTKGAQWPMVLNGVVGSFYFRPPVGWIEPKFSVPPIGEPKQKIGATITPVIVSPENVKASDEALSQARGLVLAKQYSESLPLLERAAALNPGSYQARQMLGRAHFNLGHYSKASDEFGEAIGLRGDVAQLYQDRANCYSEMRNYAEAIANLNQAIGLDPGDWQNYWFRSLARDALGDHRGSEADDVTAKTIRAKKNSISANAKSAASK